MTASVADRVLQLTGHQGPWCAANWVAPPAGLSDHVLGVLGEAYASVVVASWRPDGTRQVVQFAMSEQAGVAVIADEQGAVQAGPVVAQEELVADLLRDVAGPAAPLPDAPSDAPSDALADAPADALAVEIDDATLAALLAVFGDGPAAVSADAARGALQASLGAGTDPDAALAELAEHGMVGSDGGDQLVPGPAIRESPALAAIVSGERLQVVTTRLTHGGGGAVRTGRFFGPAGARFAVLRSADPARSLLARGGDQVGLTAAITGLVADATPQAPPVARPITGDAPQHVAPTLLDSAAALAAVPEVVGDALARPAWTARLTRDDASGRRLAGVCAAEGLAVGWELLPEGLQLVGMPIADAPDWIVERLIDADAGADAADDAVTSIAGNPAPGPRSEVLAALPLGEPNGRVRSRVVVQRAAGDGGLEMQAAAWLARPPAGAWWIPDTLAERWQPAAASAEAARAWVARTLLEA